MLKTPVSCLLELCTVNRATAIFTEEEAAENVIRTAFTIRCTVCRQSFLPLDNVKAKEFTVTGTAFSKKLAKQCAANEMLKILSNDEDFIIKRDKILKDWTYQDEQLSCKINSNSADADEGVNPVGQLNELCRRQNWVPPVYKTTLSSDSKVPNFETKCSFLLEDHLLITCSDGMSKRIAKRLAAEKMVKKVEDLEIANQENYLLKTRIKRKHRNKEEKVENGDEKKARTQDIILGRSILKWREHEVNENKVMMDLIDEAIRDLLKVSLICQKVPFDCLEALKQVAEYQNCDIGVIEVTRNPLIDVFQCLLHVTPKVRTPATIPLLSTWGHSPDSMESAKKDAARRALVMFHKISLCKL